MTTTTTAKTIRDMLISPPFPGRAFVPRWFSGQRIQQILPSVLAIITVGAAIWSCATQLQRHNVSTEGLTYIWFFGGFFYAWSKYRFFRNEWRAARRLNGQTQRLHLWATAGNIAACLTLMATNGLLIASAAMHGVGIWHWSTVALAIVMAFTFLRMAVRKGRDSKEEQRVRFAMGVNVYPTHIQGAAYALLGSGSMPWQAMTICLTMAAGMWLLALWLQSRPGSTADAGYAYTLAKRDAIAQFTMFLGGWIIGGLVEGGLRTKT